MAKYVVNLERLSAIDIVVDVDDPTTALDSIDIESINWIDAKIDQITGCCLATGTAGRQVLAQKVTVSEDVVTINNAPLQVKMISRKDLLAAMQTDAADYVEKAAQ